MANRVRVHGLVRKGIALRHVVALALGVAVLATLAAPVLAASPQDCAQRVVDDWYDNYRVDSTIYPERCYREAVELLGIDLRDYGTAEDDILRALSYARRGELDPGDGTGAPVTPVVAADPSSVPLPLVAIGVLGLVLLLAGSVGYLKRRFGGGPPASA